MANDESARLQQCGDVPLQVFGFSKPGGRTFIWITNAVEAGSIEDAPCVLIGAGDSNEAALRDACATLEMTRERLLRRLAHNEAPVRVHQ